MSNYSRTSQVLAALVLLAVVGYAIDGESELLRIFIGFVGLLLCAVILRIGRRDSPSPQYSYTGIDANVREGNAESSGSIRWVLGIVALAGILFAVGFRVLVFLDVPMFDDARSGFPGMFTRSNSASVNTFIGTLSYAVYGALAGLVIGITIWSHLDPGGRAHRRGSE